MILFKIFASLTFSEKWKDKKKSIAEKYLKKVKK